MKRAAAALLLMIAVAGPGWTAAPETEVVPFDLLATKHIVVQIKINGKGPYRVIFDTGAPFNLINNKVAKESGLVATNSPSSSLFSLLGSVEQVQIKTMDLGDLRVKDLPVIVMDHPTVALLAKALGPIEGIIGYPFFAQYKMTLDYQARKLTFTPNGYKPHDALEAMLNTVMTLADDTPFPPVVLSPAGQWGLVVSKPETDTNDGVIIKQVLPGSAAAAAGLAMGDRLLTLDGCWTDSVADAYAAAGHVPPGSTADVLVKRNGKEMVRTVKPRAGF